MSKIKLTGENSGYVEISAGQNAGNNTLETPTSGTRLVAHEGSQDVTLNANLTVNGVLTYDDVTNIDSVGIVTARNGLNVTGGSVGIGTDNPSEMLDIVGGDIQVSCATTTSTDWSIIRVKKAEGSGLIDFTDEGAGATTSDNPQYLVGRKWNERRDSLAIWRYTASGGSGGHQAADVLLQSSGDVYVRNKVGINSTTPHRELVVGDGGDISCFGENGGIYFGKSTGGFRNNGAIARAQQAGYHVSGSQVGDLVMAPEADKDLIFSSGSTNTMYERLRVTTGGNIGIGDASPTKPLTVGTTTPVILLDDQSSRTLEIRGPSTTHSATVLTTSVHDLLLGTNNTERMRIMSDGTVKIGTGTGNPILMLSASTSGTSVIQMGDTADNNIGQIWYANSDDSMRFFTNNAERVRITSAGSVGIGTDNPQEKLHILGTSDFVVDTDTSGLRFGSYGEHDIALVTGRNTSSNSSRVYIESGDGEHLRITSAGQIGMGIASPTQESGTGLHIRGASGGQTRIHLTNSDTGDTATDGFYIISQGAESGGASGEVMLQQKENKSLKFATNNTERLRITSAGSLLHKGNQSNTVDNTDGDSQASAGYPAGGATFNKNVSVNNGTSDFGQCMSMISHTKSLNLDGSTNHNMITFYNREGCSVGHIYVGYSTGGDGAVAIYKFSTFYSTNTVTAELGPSSRSSDSVSVNITSSGDTHTIRVNGNGYNGNVTVGVVFLSAGRTDNDHYGVRYW